MRSAEPARRLLLGDVIRAIERIQAERAKAAKGIAEKATKPRRRRARNSVASETKSQGPHPNGMSLTAGGHYRQNRCVSLRAAAASLLILMTIATSWLSTCGGWDPSAARRMACCAAADHQCSQVGADECCAAGEQRQNIEILSTAFVAPPPAMTLPLGAVAILAHGWRSRDDRGCVWRTSGEARLLLSVFLI